MDPTQERRYRSLRAKLDELGYRQELGFESLALVERIAADLLHTTVSLRDAKVAQAKSDENAAKFQAQVEALRRENARVVGENNDLHAKIICEKEETDSARRALEKEKRLCAVQVAEIKATCAQLKHRLEAEEKASQAKSERIMQLLAKNFHSYVETPNGSKQPIAFHPQRLTMTEPITPSDEPEDERQPEAPLEADIARVLRAAEQRIGQLLDQSELSKKEIESLHSQIDAYKEKVKLRDKEIERLAAIVEQGQDPQLLVLRQQLDAKDRQIAQFNLQIEHLHSSKTELQEKLSVAGPAALDALKVQQGQLEQKLLQTEAALTQAQTELEAAYAQITDKHMHRVQPTVPNFQQPATAHAPPGVSVDGSRPTGLHSHLLQLEKELRSAKERAARLEAANDNLRRLYTDLVKRLPPTHDDGSPPAEQGETALLHRQLASVMDELDAAMQECDRLRRLQNDANQRQLDLELSANSVAQENSHLLQESESIADRMKQLEAQLLASEKRIRDLGQRLAETESDRQAKERLAAQARAEATRVSASLELAQEREAQAVQRQQQLERELATLQDAKMETPRLRSSLATLLSQKESLQQQFDESKRDLAALKKEQGRWQKSIDDLTPQLTAWRVEIARLQEMENSMTELQSRLAGAEAAAESAKRKIEELTSFAARLQSEAAVASSAYEKAEDQITKLARTNQELVKEKERLDKLQKSLTNENAKLQDQLRRAEAPLQELRETVSKHTSTIAQLQGALSEMQRQCQDDYVAVREAKRRATQATAALQNAETELAGLRKENDNLKRDMEAVRATSVSLNQTRLELAGTVEALLNENTTLHAAYEEEAGGKQSLVDRIKELESKITSLEGMLDASRAELTAVLNQSTLLEDTAANMNERIRHLEGEKSKLEQSLVAFQAAENEAKQQLKEKSRLLIDLEYQRAKWIRTVSSTPPELSTSALQPQEKTAV